MTKKDFFGHFQNKTKKCSYFPKTGKNNRGLCSLFSKIDFSLYNSLTFLLLLRLFLFSPLTVYNIFLCLSYFFLFLLFLIYFLHLLRTYNLIHISENRSTNIEYFERLESFSLNKQMKRRGGSYEDTASRM